MWVSRTYPWRLLLSRQKWGFMNTLGRILIPAQFYDIKNGFAQGQAIVSLDEAHRHISVFIDTQGNILGEIEGQ